MTQLTAIIKLIEILAATANLSTTALAGFNEASATVKQMVVEGREPTLDEHARLNALSTKLTQELNTP